MYLHSEQNIENHVFPYLLSQISENEFLFLEETYLKKCERINKYTLKLKVYLEEKPILENKINKRIDELKTEIEQIKLKEEIRTNNVSFNPKTWKLSDEIREQEKGLRNLKHEEHTIKGEIYRYENALIEELQEFEVSNLIRLGVIKEEQINIPTTQTLEIPKDNDGWSDYLTVDVDIDVESELSCHLTELGDLFMKACTLKKTAPNTV